LLLEAAAISLPVDVVVVGVCSRSFLSFLTKEEN
jgi:hypothetical protein